MQNRMSLAGTRFCMAPLKERYRSMRGYKVPPQRCASVIFWLSVSTFLSLRCVSTVCRPGGATLLPPEYASVVYWFDVAPFVRLEYASVVYWFDVAPFVRLEYASVACKPGEVPFL